MISTLLLIVACNGGGSSGDSISIDDTGATDTAPPGPDDTAPPIDADNDNFTDDVDCDDGNASVYPGAPEICEDGVVNDCDMTEAEAQAFCSHWYSTAHAVADWNYAGLGYAARLGPVGDVNGDGLDDVVLGNPYRDWDRPGHDVSDVGATYLFLGPVRGSHVHSDHDDDSRILGQLEWDSIGWDIVPMGDLDADGYDDFAVGAADDDMNSPSGTPSVYLVHGPGRIPAYTDDMVLLQGSDQEDCLGSVLEPTPDVDGDGVADLLVGARCLGQVHLISSAGIAQEPGVDDIATLYIPIGESEDPTLVRTFAEASRFGFSLTSADLDADGQPDMIVGAPQPFAFAGNCDESVECNPLGFVSVFHGPASGAISHDDADTVIAGTADDSDLRSGEDVPDLELGVGLSAGDLDGDGYDDLIAGAPMRNEGSGDYQEGGVYVYFGPLTDTDYGIPDADLAILGDEDNDKCGGELDGSQDIDGDGHVDLLIGNGRVEVNGNSGRGEYGSVAQASWLFLGPFEGGTRLAADADWIIRDSSTERLGTQARVAGDTDGDGMKELLIGNKDAYLYLFDLSVSGNY